MTILPRHQHLPVTADSLALLGKRIELADWWYQRCPDLQMRLAAVAEIQAIYCAIEVLARENIERARDVWYANAPQEVLPPACLERQAPCGTTALGIAA